MRVRNVVRPWKANCKFVRGLGGWAFLSENKGNWDAIAFLPAVGLPAVLHRSLLTKNDRDRLKKYFHGTILGRFPTVPNDIKRCVAYNCHTVTNLNEAQNERL